MPRIAGVNIPNDKHIVIALTYIFGIGLTTSKKILKENRIAEDKKAKDLSNDEMLKIRESIVNYNIEGDLRRELQMNIRRLQEIGSYRGSRHKKKLPARGQRTKTNSRTVRGNKRTTMSSGRRKESKT
jgi:small subunit ribosomal protein S13